MEGLLSDVADTIGNRRVGLTRGGQVPRERTSRVTDVQVAAMRVAYVVQWVTAAQLAKEYGIGPDYVRQLIRGPRGRFV